jgi:hypothetical protein
VDPSGAEPVPNIWISALPAEKGSDGRPTHSGVRGAAIEHAKEQGDEPWKLFLYGNALVRFKTSCGRTDWCVNAWTTSLTSVAVRRLRAVPATSPISMQTSPPLTS